MSRMERGTRSKISVRGFLVDRDSWNEVGGFPTEYGHFSELMLGKDYESSERHSGMRIESRSSHITINPSPKTLMAELKVHYGFHECHGNHHFPPTMNQNICAKSGSGIGDKPEEVPSITQKHQRRLRWLAAVLMIQPCVRLPWFFSYYRELWETSIRSGPPDLSLAKWPSRSPILVPRHPAAA